MDTGAVIAVGLRVLLIFSAWAAKAMVDGSSARPWGVGGDSIPWLNGEAMPERDVSGKAIGPVPPCPSQARSGWQRNDAGVSVEYCGRADFLAVKQNDVEGYAGLVYSRAAHSANREAETHVYRKGDGRYTLHLLRQRAR